MKEIDNNNKSFEEIKHIDENGVEFWYARELMPILQYSKWENFKKVIEKAMIACQNSGISIKDCFPDVRKPIISGKGKEDVECRENLQDSERRISEGKRTGTA